jgi:hypothetical protein
MKYLWVIGFGFLLPKPIPVYPMGGDFVPYPYPWGQFLSRTRILIGEFPRVSGYRVPIDISSGDPHEGLYGTFLPHSHSPRR